MRGFTALPGLLLAAAMPLAAQPSPPAGPLTAEQLLAIPRPHDLRVSPDGRLVAFAVATVEPGTLRTRSRVWLADIASGDAWQATAGDGDEWAPRWRPETGLLTFLSTRGGDVPQVWGLPTRGGEPRPLTSLDRTLLDFDWAGRAPLMIGVSEVRVDDRQGTRATRPRRGTEGWRLDTYRHLVAVPLDGEAHDLTPGPRDVPLLGIPLPGFAATTLGTEIALALPTAAGGEPDIVTMAPDGTGFQPLTATAGPETAPAYSPDSRFLAYLASERAGHPSAPNALILFERAAGRRFSLTGTWDRNVEAFAWDPDSRRLVLEAADRGARALFLAELSSGRVIPVVTDGDNREAQLTTHEDRLVFVRSTAAAPPEVYTIRPDGTGLRQLTRFGSSILGTRQLPAARSEWVRGALRDSVQVWVVAPPGTGPHPLVVLLHGGAGQAWTDGWHPLMNAALLVSRGMVVAMPNLRGSAGFGTAWLAGAWRQPGGLPGDDLAAVVTALTARPDVDGTRVAVLGRGQGAGLALLQAAQGLPVATIVAHAPVVNQVSHAGTSATVAPLETWGGGVTSPAARAAMEKGSALNYAAEWSTPTLLLHGTADEVVDVSESLQALRVLQARGLDHGLVLLPGEGHEPADPTARLRWLTAVVDWLTERFHGDQPPPPAEPAPGR